MRRARNFVVLSYGVACIEMYSMRSYCIIIHSFYSQLQYCTVVHFNGSFMQSR